MGLNTITVVVIAQDGKTSNSYTLKITREEEPEIPEPMPEHINVKEWSETPSQNATGDGVTDDSNAIRLALKEAQDTGVALYFPAGTYNCNGQDLNINTSASGANSRVGKNIYIFGDGQDSILLSPGILRFYNDFTLKNMSIHKREGIFVYYLPDEGTYGNVTINNCNFYGSQLGDDATFFYNINTSFTADKGVNHVEFTNNKANYVQNVLQMCCKVKSGFIDGNILTNLSTSPTDVNKPIYGLAVGNTGTNNDWVKAINVTISNNYIKGVYNYSRVVIDDNEDSAPDLTYPIIAIGENITIINNHVEDLNKYTGIYSKATNLLIKGNTIINAGHLSSICVKVGISPNHGDNHSLLASDLIIEDNYISSNIDGKGAISVHTPYYTIRNNVIEQYDNENQDLMGICYSISARTRATIDGVIEGNTIYSEALNAIRFVDGISGKALIQNNIIHQNSMSADITGSGAINFSIPQLGSEIDCINNTIVIERARYCVYSAGVAGSFVNFSNNIITAYNVAASITYFYHMTSTVDNNEFIVYGNPSQISYFYGPFKFTNNKITFEENAQVVRIIYYNTSTYNQPNVNTDITLIANNTVVQGTSSTRTVAANYFIYISTSNATDLFPQIYINNNDVVVNYALISKGNNTALLCAGTIEINRNKVSRIITSSSGIYYSFNDEKYILGTGADENIVIQL